MRDTAWPSSCPTAAKSNSPSEPRLSCSPKCSRRSYGGVALVSLRADLVLGKNVVLHTEVLNALDEEGRTGPDKLPLAARRPMEQWTSLVATYRRAIHFFKIAKVLREWPHKLKIGKTDQIHVEWFDSIWNDDQIDRLDYYASELHRLFRVGNLGRIPTSQLSPALAQHWQQARQALGEAVAKVEDDLKLVNGKFQDLYQSNSARWIGLEDSPVIFTHQFVPRFIRPTEPQGQLGGLPADVRHLAIARQGGGAVVPCQPPIDWHPAARIVRARSAPLHARQSSHDASCRRRRTQRSARRAHTLRSDRTEEFVFIVDSPVNNSGGNRNRPPLPFGSDQRTVGRMEFASFATLAMPRHRSGGGAYAIRPGDARSQIFAQASVQVRNSTPELIFENIFLLPWGPRLMSNSHVPQFDKLTKRGNTLGIR